MTNSKQASILVCVALLLLIAAAPIQAQSNVTPGNLSFTDIVNGAGPAKQTLSVTNSSTWTVTTSTQDQGNWLSVSTNNGNGNGTIDVMVTTGSLAPGTYRGAVEVRFTNNPGVPSTVQLT